VVPDPRAAFLLPCASPSDERSASLYTTLTTIPRTTAVTSAAAEVIPARSLPELIPIPTAAPAPPPHPPPPPFSGLRPSTLNLSPAAPRRSAVVPAFDVKRIPPFYDDSETLDLSPSGRYASRTLEQSTAPKSSSALTPSSKPSVVSQLPINESPTNTNTVTTDELKATVNVPVVTLEPVHQVQDISKSETLSDVSSGVQAVGVGSQEQMPMEVSEGSSGATDALLMCPIDMSAQEQAKLERKREKNRYAAQKCRMLKLERIDQLQRRVNELKAQNAQLAGNASTLCDQVNRLRQMIVEHVEGGCQVMMVHSANT